MTKEKKNIEQVGGMESADPPLPPSKTQGEGHGSN